MKHFINNCLQRAYLRLPNLACFLQWTPGAILHVRLLYSDEDHLLAAAAWLERAQDATRDGGVSGRYKLATGWTSSYPETTGYIIPTFLDLRRDIERRALSRESTTAVEFLVGYSFRKALFPPESQRESYKARLHFNTAQIMHGLQAWVIEDGTPAV